ncbi:MAG: hypothetical protein QXM22_03110 [Candidatus Bathyarchaeia archaeon]
MRFKDWNPLKVIALGIMLCLVGALGMIFWKIILGLILFLALGVYVMCLGFYYLIKRKKMEG